MTKISYRLIKFLQRNRLKSFFVLYFIGLSLYVYQYSSHEISFLNIIKSMYYSMVLFAMDIKIDSSKDIFFDISIHILALFTGLYTILSFVELFIKDKIKEQNKKELLAKGGHIIVVGLSKTNQVYLESLDKSDPVIVIDKNVQHPYIKLLDENIPTEILDATKDDFLYKLNIEKSKHIVIATNSDTINLDIAMNILSRYKNLKLFIQVEDRHLRFFYKNNGILSNANIRIFSYYLDSARELFEKYDIDGYDREISTTDKPFSIVVVGGTTLAYEVVAQASILGQLAYGNNLNIYCIDKDINEFEKNIKFNFPQIERIKNLNIQYLQSDPESIEFYEDSVWHLENITNIILCYENEQLNLDIASSLMDRAYAQALVSNSMRTKIVMAMSDGYSFSSKITNNKSFFHHLYTFASVDEINQDKYIVAQQRDKEAIAVNYIYNHIGFKVVDYDKYEYEFFAYDDNSEYAKSGFLDIDDKGWSKLSYIDKESNRSVSDHIRIKLKFMGLQSIKSDINDTKKLFLQNQKIYDSVDKDCTLLAKMEHSRWNAFYYIHGYKPMDFVDIDTKNSQKTNLELIKQHMCLIDFEEFRKHKTKLESLGYSQGYFEGYDFMINYHIPLILAYSGYTIQKVTSE